MKLISYVHCAQEGQAQRDFRGAKSGMVLEQNEAGASITSAYTRDCTHIHTAWREENGKLQAGEVMIINNGSCPLGQ